MKTIWKFTLEITDKQVIMLPEQSKIICVQVQQGKPCIWAEVDLSKTDTADQYDIYTYGTGHEVENIEGQYIGTYQLHDGYQICHVYAEKEK